MEPPKNEAPIFINSSNSSSDSVVSISMPIDESIVAQDVHMASDRSNATNNNNGTANHSGGSLGSSQHSSSSASMVVSPPASLSPNQLNFPEDPTLVVEAEGSFRWRLANWSKYEVGSKVYSPVFRVGSYSWKLLVWPRGNVPHEGQSLSLYVAIDPDPSMMREEWAVCAQLILAAEGPEPSPSSSSDGAPNVAPPQQITKVTQHRFNAAELDWGYTQFCSLKAVEPLINVQDEESLTLSVRMRIIKDETGVLWHDFSNYNSKKVTGYVGLANQGATCYMNSLLQSLYFTNAFRRAIYQIPTADDLPQESSALALQRIFWRLQFGDVPVSTQELTRAFGWESLEAFVQSDVQEFSRVLMDELEKRMKGTAAEGIIEKLFTGKVRNVISCLNVDYASKRTESFYDLQLSIKGLHSLEESFEQYVREERLEGDNKYHAEGFGLQDAKKYVEFESFPPVLNLHLERYAFDPRVMGTVKINDRLEFPLQINLDRYLAPDSPQRSQPQNFILQSIFVHSGDSHGGHYYVFIRDPREEGKSERGGRWYRFDDTKVIPATQKEAVDDTFGGEGDIPPPNETSMTMMTRMSMLRNRDKYRRFTNAYMLVYIRESDLETVLAPIGEDDIPVHIGAALRTEEEAERQRREEKQQQLMTIKAHVITPANLTQHSSFDLFNLDNKNLPITPHHTFRIRRDEPLSKLKELVARDLELGPPDSLRFWAFAARRNKTIRLDEPIIGEEETRPVSHFYHRSSSLHTPFVLFVETIITPQEDKKSPQESQMSLITFKFYDPERSRLMPVGNLYVRPTDTIQSVNDELREMVGLPKGVALDFYEEVRPSRVDPLLSTRSFVECQLQTGDIITFQLSNPILSSNVQLPKATDYYRYLSELIYVVFTKMESHKEGQGKTGEAGPGIDENEICAVRIPLSTPFSEIIREIADNLKCDVAHLRLYLNDEIVGPIPLKGDNGKTFEEVIKDHPLPSGYAHEGIQIGCEITSVSVAQLDAMKAIKFQFSLSSGMEGESIVYLGPEDTPHSIIARLPESIKNNLKMPIRLLEIHNHRILNQFINNDSLAPIGESSLVLLEDDVDPREIDPPAGHRMISVMHFSNRDPSRTHSRPLRFMLQPHEPFAVAKGRLLSQLRLSPSEERACSFHIVAYGRARPIQDEDVLTSMELGEHDQIGVCRPDPIQGRLSLSGMERSIKIRSSKS